mmetsp:Transcript_362/g.699  ORF Transcript_362/g.699 Transcript_362/m.699 type:complete len:325 (+) Transcript_362:531-1505(+)
MRSVSSAASLEDLHNFQSTWSQRCGGLHDISAPQPHCHIRAVSMAVQGRTTSMWTNRRWSDCDAMASVVGCGACRVLGRPDGRHGVQKKERRKRRSRRGKTDTSSNQETSPLNFVNTMIPGTTQPGDPYDTTYALARRNVQQIRSGQAQHVAQHLAHLEMIEQEGSGAPLAATIPMRVGATVSALPGYNVQEQHPRNKTNSPREPTQQVRRKAFQPIERKRTNERGSAGATRPEGQPENEGHGRPRKKKSETVDPVPQAEEPSLRLGPGLVQSSSHRQTPRKHLVDIAGALSAAEGYSPLAPLRLPGHVPSQPDQRDNAEHMLM